MSSYSVSNEENHGDLTEVLRHLCYLSPVVRSDYVACELVGMKKAERAVERGVEPATVSANVSLAKKRLDAETSVDMDGFRVYHNLESEATE